MNRQLLLLALCQGLLLINNVTFIAINGLVGLALAPSPWLATLPVTAYDLVGAGGRHPWGSGRPEPRQPHANLLPTPFAGAYLALVVVALLAFLTLQFIRFPPLPVPSAQRPGRPLAILARQPVFVVAVAACALGYGVMNLLMAATPIAMAMCSHPFANTALVLEWHVLGMFVPGFFTGNLIRRVGALPVMAVGVLLNIMCIAVALSGVERMRFGIALLVLGIGWNFLFVGGTTLFTEAYRPAEKTSAQASMDTVIFTTMAITSFSSGALVTTQGWNWLNLGSIVPIAACGAAIGWLAWRRRATARLA